MGENYFELSIPPFLGLHLMFDVELLRPYFPHLLDTSKAIEYMEPIEMNLDYIEKSTIDQIMDTKMKGTNQ